MIAFSPKFISRPRSLVAPQHQARDPRDARLASAVERGRGEQRLAEELRPLRPVGVKDFLRMQRAAREVMQETKAEAAASRAQGRSQRPLSRWWPRPTAASGWKPRSGP